MTRLSRFLSELLPIEEYVDVGDNTHGIVHIQGETQIAVGALEFDHETGYFSGTPVVVEPAVNP